MKLRADVPPLLATGLSGMFSGCAEVVVLEKYGSL